MPNIIVSPLIQPRAPTGTTLWAVDKVADLLFYDSVITNATKRKLTYRKVRSMCDAGFRLHMPDTIKREYGKTYRIRADQFRIVGFFDQDYHNFVALDYFVKKTQRNDSRMTAIYQRVDAIREAGTWSKSE